MKRTWDFRNSRVVLEDFELLERDAEVKPERDGLKISSSRFLEPRPDPPPVIYAPPPDEQVVRDGKIRVYIPVFIDDPRSLASSSSSQTPIISQTSSAAKFLIFLKDEISIGPALTSLEMSVDSLQTFKAGAEFPREFRNRLRNIHADYRLCSGGPIAFDPENGLEFGFLITNQAIYAIYGCGAWIKEPPTREFPPTSARFASAVKVHEKSMRTNPEPLKLKLTYDDVKGVLNYYFDDNLVFIIRNLGHRLHEKYQVLDYGGESKSIKPQKLRFGFGHFTFLDHQLPDNYGRDMVYVDRDSDHFNTIFRSESGLCILHDESIYREIYADIRGGHGRIVPKYSFAVTHYAPRFQYFDQGVISKIGYISVDDGSGKRPVEKFLSRYDDESLDDSSLG